MSANYRDITIALGAVCQSAWLVQQTARHNQTPHYAFDPLLLSLFNKNPSNALDTYGDVYALSAGFKTLDQLFKNQRSQALHEIMRYMVNILALERRLRKRSDLLNVISQRLDKAQAQADLYDYHHENVIANLAGIYTDTISTFPMRIQVQGNPSYLENRAVQHKVRAILFAGIRAAILWRQVGGRRWDFLLKRKQLSTSLKTLLTESVH
jgi:high frequency lysogenization protein